MKAIRTLSLWISLSVVSNVTAAPPGFVKTRIQVDAPPVALAFGADGVLYALQSTFENNQATLRTIFPDGSFTSFTVTGEDGESFYVGSMAYDPWEDRLLVTDSTYPGRLYALDQSVADGRVTLAEGIEGIAGVAVRGTGEIFVSTAASGGGAVLQIDRLSGSKNVVLDGLELGAGLGFNLAGDLIVQDAHLTQSSDLLGRLQRVPITDEPWTPFPLLENMQSSFSLIVDSEGDIFTTGVGGLYSVSGSYPAETPFDNNGSSFQFAAAIAFDPGSLPFEAFAGPNAGRLAYTADFGDTFITLLTPAEPGDYNSDGIVNEADYTAWQSGFGSTTQFAADGNGDNIVDAADYVFWRHHSHPVAITTSALNPLSVPEPATMLAGLVGFVAMAVTRRRRQTHA